MRMTGSGDDAFVHQQGNSTIRRFDTGPPVERFPRSSLGPDREREEESGHRGISGMLCGWERGSQVRARGVRFSRTIGNLTGAVGFGRVPAPDNTAIIPTL